MLKNLVGLKIGHSRDLIPADRQTDRQTDKHTHNHTRTRSSQSTIWVIKIIKASKVSSLNPNQIWIRPRQEPFDACISLHLLLDGLFIRCYGWSQLCRLYACARARPNRVPEYFNHPVSIGALFSCLWRATNRCQVISAAQKNNVLKNLHFAHEFRTDRSYPPIRFNWHFTCHLAHVVTSFPLL